MIAARQLQLWQAAPAANEPFEPDLRSWPSAIGETVYGGYRAVPLESAQALAEEASALGGRLAHYARSCHAGHHRCFSLRDAASGEPLAVLALERDRDGLWVASDLEGPARRGIGDLGLRLFASCIAAQYRRADPPRDVKDSPRCRCVR